MPRPAAARPLLGYGGMLSPGARRYHVILTRHHPRPTQCKRRMPGGGTQVDLRIDQTGVRVPPIRQKSRGSTCCGSTCSFSSTRRPLLASTTVTGVTTVTVDRYWPKGYGGMPRPAAARPLQGYGGQPPARTTPAPHNPGTFTQKHNPRAAQPWPHSPKPNPSS